MEAGPVPYAQLIREQNGFALEYYPDKTSMESCYQTRYSLDRKVVKKEKRIKQRIGEASYAQHVGGYAIRYQAHGDDREGGGVASGELRLLILQTQKQ